MLKHGSAIMDVGQQTKQVKSGDRLIQLVSCL